MLTPPIFTHMRLAIAQGLDFHIVALTSLLVGLPEDVIEAHPDRIQLQFDSRYHSQSVINLNNESRTMETALSFAKLVRVDIPVDSIMLFMIQCPTAVVTDVKPKPSKPCLTVIK